MTRLVPAVTRLAGLSGLTALILSAQSKRVFQNDDVVRLLQGNYSAGDVKTRKKAELMARHQVFEDVQKWHGIHTATLLASQMTARPHFTAGLLAAGILFTLGPVYYSTLTGEQLPAAAALLGILGLFSTAAAFISMIV